jgi:hypothetical protein
MHVWPEAVDYQTPAGLDVLAYGIDLKMVAYAGTRQRACDRWKALVSFVDDVVQDFPKDTSSTYLLLDGQSEPMLFSQRRTPRSR